MKKTIPEIEFDVNIDIWEKKRIKVGEYIYFSHEQLKIEKEEMQVTSKKFNPEKPHLYTITARKKWE